MFSRIDRALVALVGIAALVALVLLGGGCSFDQADEGPPLDPELLHCQGELVCGPPGCKCTGVEVSRPDAGAEVARG
jgi:hypothetical protein